MAKRTTMNVSVTPQQGAMVSKLVKSGRFQSNSEVVRASLRLLADREKMQRDKLRWLRAELRKGSRSIAAGHIYDADGVFAEIDRRDLLAQRRRRKSA